MRPALRCHTTLRLLLDAVVANSGSNNVLVYPGVGNGQFGALRSFFAGTNPASTTILDLTGDGIPDLVVPNQGSNDVSILFGQGHLPKRHDPMVDRVDVERLKAGMRHRREAITQMTDRMPLHSEFIARTCPAPQVAAA